MESVATTTANIFTNCGNEVHVKDEKYFQCTIPEGADPCVMLKDLHEAKNLRKYVLAVVPSIISSAAVIINIAYGLLIIYLWRKKRLSWKHRYAFLLSRTVSTVIAIALFYATLLAWKFAGFEYTSVTIFILVASITFLTFAGTYLAMTWLLYMAVVHPLKYRYVVTTTRCWLAVSAIWIISIAFALCIALLGATLFYPDTAPVRCPFASCQRPFAVVVTCVIAAFFITVISFYVIMLYRMHQHNLHCERENQEQGPSNANNIRTMNRLAFNMITFAVGSMPILIVTIITTVNLQHLAHLGLGTKSSCKTFLNAKLFMQAEILACVAATVWTMAMVVDPLINIYVDSLFLDTLRSFYRKMLRRDAKHKNSSTSKVVISSS
uniref:G-protein coupled receptors family 1 profile domain-containing protein n=1 Tax=Ascaris lumbricoides TaxID=6252 RepID=A0A9J2P236_ASCLU